MRIVYLNPCGQLGGAETSLRELLRGIHSAAPDWELWLVLGEDGPFAEVARGLGVQVVVKPFPRSLARLGDGGRMGTLASFVRAAGATAGYAWSLAGWLRKIQPDIIHSNGFKMHLLGAMTRTNQMPLVWHVHDYVSSRRVMSRLVRLFQKRCTVAVVNSYSVASDLARVAPDLKIFPIYNAVDSERFSPAGTKCDLDLAAGLAPSRPGTLRVGLVSTFARWKGHRVFLQALAEVNSLLPVRGYVIGGAIYQTDGSQWSETELREEASQLGLQNSVGFTGFLSDIPAAMRSLDIVVHTSTEPEPFGMVIIEAMACGRAVIASRAGGASELFIDGENALGFSPGDSNALARQILRLAADEGLRQRLGAVGRATAERSYSTKRMANELLAVYSKAVGASLEREPESALKAPARVAEE